LPGRATRICVIREFVNAAVLMISRDPAVGAASDVVRGFEAVLIELDFF